MTSIAVNRDPLSNCGTYLISGAWIRQMMQAAICIMLDSCQVPRVMPD